MTILGKTNQTLRKTVHQLSSGNYGKAARIWSASFLGQKFRKPIPDNSLQSFNQSCFNTWGVPRVRFILNKVGTPLDRCLHNKVYLVEEAPLDGFFIPDINVLGDFGVFTNAPIKYKPFLEEVITPFKRIVFYNDVDSDAYYQLDGKILYVNMKFDDDCPMSIIHEVVARHIILPEISRQLFELRQYQNEGVAPIDSYSNSLEERFVRDYVGYMMGHCENVFLSSLLR